MAGSRRAYERRGHQTPWIRHRYYGRNPDDAILDRFADQAGILSKTTDRLIDTSGILPGYRLSRGCEGWLRFCVYLAMDHPDLVDYEVAFVTHGEHRIEIVPDMASRDAIEAWERGEITIPQGFCVVALNFDIRKCTVDAVNALLGLADRGRSDDASAGLIRADSPSEDRPPANEPPPKEPSEEAIQCYRLIVLRGDLTSQRSIAKQVYGDESKQYQVSRDLKVVKKWIKAGNVLPDLDSPRPKIYPADPAKLNRGARPEGSYARRKHR